MNDCNKLFSLITENDLDTLSQEDSDFVKLHLEKCNNCKENIKAVNKLNENLKNKITLECNSLPNNFAQQAFNKAQGIKTSNKKAHLIALASCVAIGIIFTASYFTRGSFNNTHINPDESVNSNTKATDENNHDSSDSISTYKFGNIK